MDTKEHEGKLILKEEVYTLVSCALEVLREIGHGFHEKPYENALVIEFRSRQIPFDQQKNHSILYKGQTVGTYIPDLIAYNSVIIDTKVIDRITDLERGQMLNYLKSRPAGLASSSISNAANWNGSALSYDFS